ncbi:MAG: hypothetical protein LBS26_07270 [Campylobacteraceae bacterium]|nr:hypothetical protein [Campylobacteraceae bacterium]
MLKLPHKPPILFAKEILHKGEDWAEVAVEFPKPPTLGMMMESAAQSSAALNNSEKEGYLLSCSNLILHKEPTAVKFNAHIKNIMSNSSLNEICFEIKEQNTLISSGTLLVMLQS